MIALDLLVGRDYQLHRYTFSAATEKRQQQRQPPPKWRLHIGQCTESDPEIMKRISIVRIEWRTCRQRGEREAHDIAVHSFGVNSFRKSRVKHNMYSIIFKSVLLAPLPMAASPDSLAQFWFINILISGRLFLYLLFHSFRKWLLMTNR